MELCKIKKRDCSIVDFDKMRILSAITRAFKESNEGGEPQAKYITDKVCTELSKTLMRYRENTKLLTESKEDFTPEVEQVQDIIERHLMLNGFISTAKAYIIYRHNRTQIRNSKGSIAPYVKKIVKESKKYFKNSLAEFIFYRTYSRWIEKESRRESWIETVNRYIDFMKENLKDTLTEDEYTKIRHSILRQEAMPSMRLLQFAGKAARTTNVCAYNCTYIAPVCIKDLSEILYILMCGTGVGFSVESQNIDQFPIIKKQTGEKLEAFVIPDSKEGWADALNLGISTWYSGKDIEFDFSKLRPAGARLKTMGGKSSGSAPLKSLLSFARNIVLKSQGNKLDSLSLHDIICKIGECVVSGGVRRSALISLSNLNDTKLRDAKKGQFYLTEPHRSLANNSATYNEKPSVTDFLEEWVSLIKSNSGERGIFNRSALKNTLPKRRKQEGYSDKWGTNPCGEIILRSKQFCNLSEIVARQDDTLETLLSKIKIATILGTYQSSLTKFPYLSKEWAENCKEERLLGVSITGQWDCPIVRDPKVLEALKNEALKVNKEYAKKFGINESTCITCVKPSGTLSQLVDCSSGMHPRYAPYYIRRVRISATDSLFKMLKNQGVPYHPEIGQNIDNVTTYVLDFPVKSPDFAIFKNNISAHDQLKHWKLVKEHYTEHNPSVTISVGEDEWLTVGNWLYNNWNVIGGLSFLPRFDHVYKLAPYEEITKKQYEELFERVKHIDFSKIINYEKENDTDVKREYACVAGNCEI